MFGLETPLATASSQQRTDCGCEASVEGHRMVVDATDCTQGGNPASEPECRRAVVRGLEGNPAEAIAIRTTGRERTYRGAGRDLFVTASGFAASVADHDERLADTARRDPLAAAHEATGRAGPAALVATDTGLARFDEVSGSYDALLSPRVGLSWSRFRVDPTPPPDARLERLRTLDTGSTVRVYASPARGTRTYHLEPEARDLEAGTVARLAAAYEHLATTGTGGPVRAPRRAVRAVARDSSAVTAMTRILEKHTRAGGLLRDCFADLAVSDVYITAPATENPLRVRVDGETLETNVYLTADGVEALASRFRRESGRGFSRAAPTIDAATHFGDRRVRVAGVTAPVSDGQAFALRAHDRDVWRLPALVGNGTLPAEAAGLLSLAVDRGAAVLVAGPRGSGKTTLLGALLWELPAAVRTVCIEDAPELPVTALQDAGRDVQGLRADDDGPLDPAEALRSALRLGDGALVVGEVRGEEAAVLYEAMRIGANSEAVLGTIHGDGAASVLERVVSDLGVPATSFATTDLVVTLETVGRGTTTSRRVRTIEEVHGTDPVAFTPLFERDGETLVATGRIDRGNSHLLAELTPPDGSYESTREAMAERADAQAGAAMEKPAADKPTTTRPARQR